MPVTHPQINATTSGLLNEAIDQQKNAFYDSLGLLDFQPNPIIMGAFEETKSEGAQETHAQPKSAPRWRHWPRNTGRSRQNFGELFDTIVNLDWEDSILAHMNDLKDDRTGGKIRKRAMECANRFLQLRERILLQILLASTDVELLPSLPTDANGLALLSASHSFATGGNVLTGSGVSSAELITDDLYSLVERANAATDTVSGEPYFPNGVSFDQIRIIASGVANRKAWGEALRAIILPGGLSASSTVSNIVPIEMPGIKDKIYFCPRLTGNDWFAYFDVPGRPKPLIWQLREAPQHVETNIQNSDLARNKKLISFDWDARFGVGIMEARLFYHINN